ncbi:MAG: RNHCP domain-containing protein [Minisyncoccota bacterium]|jgi:hypothetical protein
MGFKRNKEDFVCEHCGKHVQGDGYTNHCPACLWSKHVDVDPGDRAAACGGMMKPTVLEGTTPKYVIVHVCERCDFRRRNKVQSNDEPAAIVALSGKH